jgi:PAS domain S-box-containing protein
MVSGVRPGIRRLLEMLECAPASIGLLTGPELRWSYANQSLVASSGRTNIAELLGKTVRESLPEVEGQGYFEMLDEVYRTGKPFNGAEQKIVIGKGSGPVTRYVNFVCQPLQGDAGQTDSILIHSVDVTDQVLSRRAVEQNDDRFRLAQAAARMGIFEWDPSADTRILSEELHDIFGTRPQDLNSAAQWILGVHGDDRQKVESRMRQAAETGELEVDFRYNHPSRGTRWLYSRGRRLGDVPALFGVVLDITDRKEAEEILRQKEEDFRQLAESMPHLVWMAKPEGPVFWCNRRWYEYSGLTPEYVEQFGWKTIFDPDTFPEVRARWNEAIATKLTFEMVFGLRGADGVYRPFLSRAVPLRDAAGNVTRWLGTNTEIDSEMRVRKELEENQLRLRDALVASQRLAAIVESSDDAIISKDLNGIVTSWNSAAMNLFGYSSEEMIGRSILTIIPPQLQSEEPIILESIRTGKKIEHHETERMRKDGTLVKVSLTISPVRDPEGRVIGASKIARDVTERVRLQEAIMQSEKLVATGRMAAAIAHEINNPLEAVTNLAYLLTTDPSLNASARKYAELLLSEIDRISHVAKQSLGFFRDTSKPGEFDVCELIAGVIEINQRLLDRKHIELTPEFSAGCTVFGSAAELRQVFSNLLSNAMDAVGEGARIRIRVRSNKAGIRRILIADNGHGIPAHVRARLFQPFATSKGSSGNGLGLWVSHGIVRKHGGSIRVKTSTAEGRSGTVFVVNLPGVQGLVGTRLAALGRGRDFSGSASGLVPGTTTA